MYHKSHHNNTVCLHFFFYFLMLQLRIYNFSIFFLIFSQHILIFSYTIMSIPSTILNEKLRGKKLNISSDKKNLISNALSLVWSITNKKIESCTFLTKNTGDVVKIIYKGGEGSFFFDLHNEDNKELLTDFMVRIGLFFSILSYIKSLTYLSNYFSNDNVSKASVEQGANKTKGGKE